MGSQSIVKPAGLHIYSLRMCYNYLFPTGMQRTVTHSKDGAAMVSAWVFWYECMGWQFEGPNADQAT